MAAGVDVRVCRGIPPVGLAGFDAVEHFLG
jgi:hypothetical protein